MVVVQDAQGIVFDESVQRECIEFLNNFLPGNRLFSGRGSRHLLGNPLVPDSVHKTCLEGGHVMEVLLRKVENACTKVVFLGKVPNAMVVFQLPSSIKKQPFGNCIQ